MSTSPATARTLASKRALVVDDDPMMRELLTDMLDDLGVGQIATADSGSRAAATLASPGMPPDFVVCDLNMPDGDGFVLMEALAQRQYRGGVVLMSGLEGRILNSAGLMARFHRLNILGTLPKPVQASALAEVVGKLA